MRWEWATPKGSVTQNAAAGKGFYPGGIPGGDKGRYPAGAVASLRMRSLLAATLLAGASCFDSDEKLRAAGTGTTAGTTGLTPPDPWTTGQGGTSTTGPKPVPETTCRDAIECVFGCAAGLPMPLPPEPDLSCFLDCDMGLDEEEALKLLRLTDCVAMQCAEKGYCDAGGTTGGDTGTGGTAADPGMLDPCTNCIFVNVQDPQPAGCLDEAAACE